MVLPVSNVIATNRVTNKLKKEGNKWAVVEQRATTSLFHHCGSHEKVRDISSLGSIWSKKETKMKKICWHDVFHVFVDQKRSLFVNHILLILLKQVSNNNK